MLKPQNGREEMHLNLKKIPEILQDNTDRNRTSPFAFTGNKFEFRAVGSSFNCAGPMTALNLMLADQLAAFRTEVEKLISGGIAKEEAIFQVLRNEAKQAVRIVFEGNSYAEEWVNEAGARGLSNLRTTPEALEAFDRPESISLFTGHNILTERELKARRDISYEQYTLKLQIEARVLGDLAKNHIIPVVIEYQNRLIENVRGLKEILDLKTFEELAAHQIQTIRDISGHILGIRSNVSMMIAERKLANRIEDPCTRATAYRDRVLPYFGVIRRHADKLELLVDDELWPLPKYREMLFF